jgi:hypothetical protein
MKIDVRVDTTLLDKNAKRYAKNLSYSTAQALNDAAKAAQTRIRANLRERFKIRNAAFMDRTIKIFAFANVGAQRPFAELGVDNSKKNLILSIFEEGGARLPFVGKNVAVPITGQAARPSFDASVRSDLTFTALNFRKGKTVRTKVGKSIALPKHKLGGDYLIWQGNQRTFILPSSRRAPLGGVFMRVGPKRDDIRLIYSFKANVRLKRALGFVDTTSEAFADTFREAFFRRFYRLNA